MSIAQVSNDLLLERITYQVPHEAPAPIPWPDGLAPRGVPYGGAADAPLPSSDVVVVTWTVAEGQALADVLTPGMPSTSWKPYAYRWESYETQLTGRSPAREAGLHGSCGAGQDRRRRGAGGEVGAAPGYRRRHGTDRGAVAADSGRGLPEAGHHHRNGRRHRGGHPARRCFRRHQRQVQLHQEFKNKPWAQRLFTGPGIGGGGHAAAFDALVAPNAGRLDPVATRAPALTFGGALGGVETVDYFGFANTDDSYGIVRDYPDARTEEMNDATLPLALADLADPPQWCSIRNASDPQVSSSIGDLEAQGRWANEIYKRYGYWTSVGSAIATWAVIANLT